MRQETVRKIARLIHVVLPGVLVADAVHNAYVVHNLWRARQKVCRPTIQFVSRELIWGLSTNLYSGAGVAPRGQRRAIGRCAARAAAGQL